MGRALTRRKLGVGMPAQPKPEKDEPVKVPLDPEEALRALLQVEPDEAPSDEERRA
jgi:hypothetical protein